MLNDLAASTDRALIIADASCLIGLSNVRRLDILCSLFENIIITPEVAAEFGETLPAWIRVLPVKNTVLQTSIEAFLHKGEASAIALALENPGSLIILDDKQARRFAISKGLDITGTLGVLTLAGQVGIISNVEETLNQLRNCGFR